MFIISLAVTQNTYAASIAVNIPSNSSVPGCERTNSCYTPSAGAVLVGDSVTWINNDSAAHTVTSGNPSKGPDGLFDSGLFTTGKSFSYKFTSIGRYDYFCAVHPWMTGYVTVSLPANVSITNGTFTRGLQYPPVAVISPISGAYEGAKVTLDGSKSYDPDRYPKALSYKWVQTRGVPVTIIDESSAIASFIAPQVNATQQLGFQLTVNDGQYSSTSDAYVTLAMSIQNIPPVAKITPLPQSSKGAQVVLDGSGSYDPDDSPNQLSYRWTQVGGAQIKIQDPYSRVTSFISPASDSGWPLQFELLVNDGVSSSRDTATISLKKESQIEITYIVIPIAAGAGIIALKAIRCGKKDEPHSKPRAASVRYETNTGFEQ